MKSKSNSNILIYVLAVTTSLFLCVISIINIVILQNKNWSVRSYMLGLIVLVSICSFIQLLFVGIYALRKRLKKTVILIMENITLFSSILIIIDYIIFDNWFQHNGFSPTNECSVMPTSIILNTLVLIGFIAEAICLLVILLKNKNQL